MYEFVTMALYACISNYTGTFIYVYTNNIFFILKTSGNAMTLEVEHPSDTIMDKEN